MVKLFRPADNFIATTLCLIQIARSVNADKGRPKIHYTKPTKCTKFFYIIISRLISPRVSTHVGVLSVIL